MRSKTETRRVVWLLVGLVTFAPIAGCRIRFLDHADPGGLPSAEPQTGPGWTYEPEVFPYRPRLVMPFGVGLSNDAGAPVMAPLQVEVADVEAHSRRAAQDQSDAGAAPADDPAPRADPVEGPKTTPPAPKRRPAAPRASVSPSTSLVAPAVGSALMPSANTAPQVPAPSAPKAPEAAP